MKLQMGVKAKCKVTGLTGIITGRTEYLNGCIQWLVKPPVDKDGKIVEGHWIDEGQLEIIDEGIAIDVPSKGPGGPMRDAPPLSYRG